MSYRVIRLDAGTARSGERISINAKIVNFRTVPVALEVGFDSETALVPIASPEIFEKCADDGAGFVKEIFITHSAGAGEIVILTSGGGLRSSFPLAASAEANEVFAHMMGNTGTSMPVDIISGVTRLVRTASAGAVAQWDDDATNDLYALDLECPADANAAQSAVISPTTHDWVLPLTTLLRTVDGSRGALGQFFVEDTLQGIAKIGDVSAFFGFGAPSGSILYGAGIVADDGGDTWRLEIRQSQGGNSVVVATEDTGINFTDRTKWTVLVGADAAGTPLVIAEADGVEVARLTGPWAFDSLGGNYYFGVHRLYKVLGNSIDTVHMFAMIDGAYRWGRRAV